MDPAQVIGIHSGETGLAIGNGPSLKEAPRTLLEKYPSFGVNYIDKLPFQPTYYVCIDTPVLTQHAEQIHEVAAASHIAFLSSYHLNDPIPPLQSLYSLPNVVLLGQNTFSLPGEKVMSGWTAVYVALKIAFHMGFQTVLLIGVDHTPTWEHFSDDYPAGNPMSRGRFEGQREHFRIAAEAFASLGRSVINLSPPSELDAIFPRDEYKHWK